MKREITKIAMAILILVSPLSYLPAQQSSNAKKLLNQEYNLIPRHSKDTQYYEMESTLQQFALDGTPRGADIYRLYLRCVPSVDSLHGDEYTCLKFTLQLKNSGEVVIPSLTNWKYFFSLTPNDNNKTGEVLGIDHSKFEQLKDESGKPLAVENTYHVYNAFIDFHSMSVFAEKATNGNGIQNLKHIGDKIVHAASFSQPPVDLGTQVAKGSYFKNGEITLTLKGLSRVNEETCALLEYDSGESSFYMLTKPMPTMEVTTKGSSHYWGDIYKDLKSGWIQKANLHELVISETIVPGMDNKINSVIERSINISNSKHLNLNK
ncbi:MAG: hypothetical protein Q8941_02575 [Bacteroidota bacterium]|nr:hypothetical protein [Bacteroidota bacterium]